MSTPTFRFSLAVLAVALVLPAVFPAQVRGQEAKPAEQTSSATKAPEMGGQVSPDAAPQPNATPPAVEEHKKQVVTVGMLVLVGVVLVGLMLIGMTVAWGSRVRKIARKPLPPQSPVDELWYLKAKKNPGNETAGKGAASGGETAPDSDRPESS